MKMNELITKAQIVMCDTGFKLRKASPKIYMTLGIIGTVGSAVLACKATTKLDQIKEEHKESLENIVTCAEKGEVDGEEYTQDDAKHDTAIVTIQTGYKIAKLYAPAIGLGILSLTAIIASNKILSKRNAALAAAYTAIDTSFKDYRKRVIEQFGKETDYALKHGIKAEKGTITVIDEGSGKEKKVKQTVNKIDPKCVSDYDRLFSKYVRDENGNYILDEDGNKIINYSWEPNFDVNLMYLKAQEAYANELLRTKKRLFLNDVYKILGFPPTKAGQVVGWVFDDNNPDGDNYVDFGIYADNLVVDDEDGEPSILLNFNPDGNIWAKM